MARLSMRKIREVLRLRYEVGLSARQVADSVQVARSSVGEYERRLAAADLSWPLPDGLSDTELERRLYPPPLRVQQNPIASIEQLTSTLSDRVRPYSCFAGLPRCASTSALW